MNQNCNNAYNRNVSSHPVSHSGLLQEGIIRVPARNTVGHVLVENADHNRRTYFANIRIKLHRKGTTAHRTTGNSDCILQPAELCVLIGIGLCMLWVPAVALVKSVQVSL